MENDERTYKTWCLDCRNTGSVMLDDRTVKAYLDDGGKKRPVRCGHPADRQVPNPPATPEQHAAFIARIMAQFGGGTIVHAPKAPPPIHNPDPFAPEICSACGAIEHNALIAGLCRDCDAEALALREERAGVESEPM